MKKFDALVAGLRELGRSKRYLFLIYMVNMTITVIVAVGLAQTIEGSLGKSAASENLLHGFDDLWGKKFSNDAKGFASTFDPSVTGIGAVFNGLDSFLQGKLLKGSIATARGQFASANVGIVGIGLIYLLMWTFFSGGLISVYAAQYERPSFLLESARCFPRLLILGILAGAIYILLFRYALSWLSDLVDNLTRETIDERVHFTYTLLKYLVFGLVLWTVNMIFDYAKIITVVRDRGNVLTAPVRAAGVVFGNLGKTYGLYFIVGGLWIALMLFYWLVAPGAGQSTWAAILGTFLIGQLYIMSRIGTRCLFYSSQTALYTGLESQQSDGRDVAAEAAEVAEKT